MTVKFNLDLGFKGSAAYCQTFTGFTTPNPNWQGVADEFITTVRQFEKERKTSVSVP
jgi:hypothetical protein